MKAKVTREELKKGNDTLEANRKIAGAAELFKPYGREWIGTLAFHFYAGTQLNTSTGEIQIATQRVNWNLSKEAGATVHDELREMVQGSLGLEKQKLAPSTVEETQDMGGHLSALDQEIQGIS